MKEIVALAVGGAFGTIGRYGVSLWALRAFGPYYAFGTLIVNVSGCFLLGALMEAGFKTEAIAHPLRLAVTVGFLGAFTTFSTFGYETIRYVENGLHWLAAANVAANVVFGILAAWGGVVAARAMLAAV